MPRQKQQNKQIIVGVTGSFGSGKSTVSRIFKSYGARVIDADKIAHQCIKPGRACYGKIVSFFGRDILRRNKEIDRKKLAAAAFAKGGLIKKLNQIIHPEVIRLIKDGIKKSGDRLIVLDVPLLFESGLDKLVDKLVVVSISRSRQSARIRKNIPLKKSEISARIKYQIPLSRKVRMADFVIDNNGTLSQTRKQVKQIRRKLWKS